MLPLHLSMKDFCSHAETEINFTDISSAVIIGRIKNNERFSNTAGKTTIFNAIKYVLFNEIDFSSLERTIRDDCDHCRVSFEFLSSIDNEIYKIVRSNSRKAGTDARLFRKSRETWEDLTQRRVLDTEKEIVKVLGFNYKTFCATALFSQSGTESNVQKEFGNLPALTPEKRKSILREVIQLHLYASYEKIAKQKLSSFQKDAERNSIILETLGNPEKNIKELSLSLSKENKILQILSKNHEVISKEYSDLKSKYLILEENRGKIIGQINDLKQRGIATKAQVDRSEKLSKELSSKIEFIPNLISNTESIIQTLLDRQKSIKTLSENELQFKSNLLTELRIKIADKEAEKSFIKKQEIEQKEKSKLPNEENCERCHQLISHDHKNNWRVKTYKELENLNKQAVSTNEIYNKLMDEKHKLESELSDNNKLIFSLKEINFEISAKLKELEILKSQISQNKNSLKENETNINLWNLELVDLREKITNLNQQNSDISSSKLEEMKVSLASLRVQRNSLTEDKTKLSSSIAIISHQIEQEKLNQIKLSLIKDNISKLDQDIKIHSLVAQGFGSNGIPALVIHSVLDELQEKANEWLAKLRPGLQLQFQVINDKSNKEKEDTLEILYFTDGREREYKQLSGAQKITVSLSIKLALLALMNKRLGVNIKMMLLDEVDQALDDGSLDVFPEIIRIIQEDYKVLVITHNATVKHSFSHAIIVDQDENGVSRGQLTSW